jgi:hypothetical protein
MSTETVPYTLAEYITALISELGSLHPTLLARMRLIVGDRRARVVLDDEAVDVFFSLEGLHVRLAAEDAELSGEGATDAATVLELLDGYLEVSEAILSNRLRVFGQADDVVRMFMAIEILLDASPRTPSLQDLAAKFRRDKRQQPDSRMPNIDRVPWYPFNPDPGELQLLTALDLLPDTSSE